MFLKNYTSDVPVSESIRRIEQVLIQCGVKNIGKEYGIDQKVVALTFTIEDEGRPWLIRLPAREKEAADALWRDYMGDDLLPNGDIKWSCRKKMKKDAFTKQGERTAWRVAKDWVEVQMSLVQLKQVTPLQVFLAYAWDGKRTYYDALKQSGYAGLLGRGAELTDDVIEAEVA
jgi:hypothetical protein